MILLLFAGCINDEVFFQRIVVSGNIVSDTVDAPVYISAHHAWFGEGVLRIPVKKFASVEILEAGDFTWTVDVPLLEEAEGLALYAWQDLDGDGDFCSLEGAEEFSDLVEVAFPSYSAVVEHSLENSCVAPENFWTLLNP